jgi:proteasome lid subunit RPN8/RPN11
MTEVPILQPGVLDAIREHHASAAAGVTVGGILLGWTEGEAVTVEHAVPARAAEQHAGEIVFASEDWDAVYSRMETAGPDSKVVGWYHVTAWHDLSLSDYDRSLHRTLFSDASQVALVLLPGTWDLAWFGWQVERIGRIEPKAAPAATEPAPVEAEDWPRRSAAVWWPGAALLALLLVAGALGGGFAWGRSSAPAVASATDDLGAELQAARAERDAFQHRFQQAAGRLVSVRHRLFVARERLRVLRRLRRLLQQAPPRMTFTFRYQVRAGDTMSRLADIFYGDPKLWRRIWKANPTPNPNVLFAGQWLNIPLRAEPRNPTPR